MEIDRPNPGDAAEQVSPAVFAVFATHLLPQIAQDNPDGWRGLVRSDQCGIVAVELSGHSQDAEEEGYAITLRKPADIPTGGSAAGSRINEATTYYVLPSRQLRVARRYEPSDASSDVPNVPVSLPQGQGMSKEDLALIMEAWYDAGIISWADLGRQRYLSEVGFREGDIDAISLTGQAVKYLYEAGALLMEQPKRNGAWSEQFVGVTSEKRITVGMYISQTLDRGLLAIEADQLEERACEKDIPTVRAIWRAMRAAHSETLSLPDMAKIMKDAFTAQRASLCRGVRYAYSEEQGILTYEQQRYYRLNSVICPISRLRQGFSPTGAECAIPDELLYRQLQETGTVQLPWSQPRLTSEQLSELSSILHRLDLRNYPARWG